MDIKFNFVQFSLFFAIIILTIGTSSAGHRSRGTGRIPFRRNNRREVRDYLAPPPHDAPYTNYGPPSLQPPPLIPYRPGRLINPPPTTEAPGYFSRLASWLNPFGGSPTPPPLPEIYSPKYSQPHAPSQGYGPPLSPPPIYGPPVPQPPSAGPHGYLPPKGKGKNCNPCNNVPWIPMPGVVQKDALPSSGVNVEIQPSINQEAKNQGDGFSLEHAEEVRAPDFSYGSPPDFSIHGNPFPGPIPYPHLYPGPMPPLFKSKPFNPSGEGFQPTPSIQVDSGPIDHSVDSILTEDGHVEVLPPGAEVDDSGGVGEIRDTPPPSYEDENSSDFNNGNNHQGSGYESTGFNVQQSTAIHEEHLSTELTSGYKIQTPSTAGVELFESIPATDFTASVDHPIHYEQSPIIDLSKENQKGPESSGGEGYTAGLNPPPIESVHPYDSSLENSGPDTSKETGGKVIKDSYGIPINQEPPPKDSFVASTVTNKSISYSTPTYGIPDVGGLPISHETVKTNTYENYPPSTEKFLISVTDPIDNSRGPLPSGGQSPNLPSQEQRENREQHEGGHQDHGKVVDSYQQQIEQSSNSAHQQNGQSGFPNTPEPLVPYRPSSVYVPYPPYSGPHGQQNGLSSSGPSGHTTEEPFLNALLKSYNTFKQEMAAKDQLLREHQDRAESQKNQGSNNFGSAGDTTWISQQQSGFPIPEQVNPGVYISGNMMPPPVPSSETRQQPLSGTKKNKQVQIIIPYTSQYTPSPFQPIADDWSGRGPLEQSQGRKVPVLDIDDQNYVGQESKKIEVTSPLRPLANLLMKEVARKPLLKHTNNSIDVLRLQKNIDNWTIQEYSRGITSSTALPSSSHPYLLPSKKIPSEYLSNNQSSRSEERIDTNQPDLPGFTYNDLEHEGAASIRVDIPHVQVLTGDRASKPVQYETKPSSITLSTESTTVSTSSTMPLTSTTITTTEPSWLELPVSISPHNNERVYVVTPQPVRSSKSEENINEDFDKSGKFEAIERAYQVLPQAVNNLASTSISGPEHSPLWGIMEHDQYANNDQENSTTSLPILYSGHSKVSNANPQ